MLLRLLYASAVERNPEDYDALYNWALVLQLPLPHLKNGYLTAPPIGNTAAPHCDWKRTEFFLDHEALRRVADSWESLDGWLDAIRLVYTIYARGKTDVLAGIITG
ncbi:hypothetical protein V6N13_041104 [Hibiscus sabdariffa]